MQEKSRIEWIDYAKVIGIGLVVFEHILNWARPIEGNLYTIVYSFHMPFFFFVSGLLFRPKELPFKPFQASKIKSLLVPPYTLLNLLCVVLSIPMYLCSAFPISNLQDAFQDIMTIMEGKMGSNFSPPSWFLISLFMAMIITYFVQKWETYGQIPFLTLMIGLTYVLIIYKLPFCVDKLHAAFIFIYLEHQLHGRIVDSKVNILQLIICTIVFIGLHVPLAIYNGQVHINSIIGRTVSLYWVVAVMGIAALCLTAKVISRVSQSDTIRRAVRFLSVGTIIILCVYEVLLNYTMDFFLVNHSFQLHMIVRELILAMMVLGMFIPIIGLVKRYVPILNGYRK